MRDGAANVVGIDEVGRGPLAGPVTVGAVLVHPSTRSAPTGVRDSKLLSPAARSELAPRLRRWAPAWGLGHASAAEIDTVGIVVALRLAAVRALRALQHPIGAVLLDGSHDWLGDATGALPEFPAAGPVITRVKADRDCSSVAAASVLAKVARDDLMLGLAQVHPQYGWAANKGYAAPEHLAALAEHGPTGQHRLSWQLPDVPLAALDGIDPQRRRTRRRCDQGEQLVLLDAGEHQAG